MHATFACAYPPTDGSHSLPQRAAMLQTPHLHACEHDDVGSGGQPGQVPPCASLVQQRLALCVRGGPHALRRTAAIRHPNGLSLPQLEGCQTHAHIRTEQTEAPVCQLRLKSQLMRTPDCGTCARPPHVPRRTTADRHPRGRSLTYGLRGLTTPKRHILSVTAGTRATSDFKCEACQSELVNPKEPSDKNTDCMPQASSASTNPARGNLLACISGFEL